MGSAPSALTVTLSRSDISPSQRLVELAADGSSTTSSCPARESGSASVQDAVYPWLHALKPDALGCGIHDVHDAA